MTVRQVPIDDYPSVVDEATQLVDVREPAELEDGALPGVCNIPIGELPARVGELDMSRRVVLVCRSGGRSGKAAVWLDEMGFSDVVNLSGGMLACTSA